MKKLVALALFVVVCFAWLVAPLVADGTDPVVVYPNKSATSPGDDSKTDTTTILPAADDGKSVTEIVIESLGLDPIVQIALVELIDGK
jgi:hypothetical protein